MKFAAWYGILVGVLMLVQWGSFLATGQVPELRAAPLRIAFHLAGEGLTAMGLFISGIALLKRKSWAKKVYLVVSGMLIYSVIASPGYFAQQGQWPMVAMFSVLFVLALVSLARVNV
jgi:hypothetical protein